MELMGDAGEQAAVHYRLAGWTAQAGLWSKAGALFYGPTPVEEAIECTLALLDQASDRSGEAGVASCLGGLRAMTGRFDEARLLIRRSCEIFDDLGAVLALQRGIAPIQMEIERLSGDFEAAVEIGRTSLEILLQQDGDAWAGLRATRLATLELTRGRIDAAADLVAIARASVNPEDVVARYLLQAVEARLLARTGEHERALALARDSTMRSATTDATGDRVETLVALAEVLRLLGRDGEAHEAQIEAEQLLIAKGNTAGLTRLRDDHARATSARAR
jgi:tetratricopeptide (TPR) repeat protein